MKTIASLFLSLLLASLAARQANPGQAGAATNSQPATAPVQASSDSPKPAPEMEKLIEMWAGHWTTVEQFEPSAEMPQGKQDKGAETMRPGPGGLSLIGDYESHGALFGHLVVTWIPQERVYKSFWLDRTQPGVSFSTGRWEGEKLVFTGVDESAGQKLAVRDTYSDITPTSFTDVLETGPVGGPMKKILTVKYTKQNSAALQKAPSDTTLTQTVSALTGFSFVRAAHLGDCKVSKKFEIKKAQRLAGALKDPMEAPLSGFQLDLLRGGKTVLSRTTDNNGVYDFGDVPPGKYKIRLNGINGFCAPPVKCDEAGCKINSILKLGPQTTVVL